MTKKKFKTNVEPFYKEIEIWITLGMTDKDIASKLGVAYSTFRKYINEESELAEKMRLAKIKPNAAIAAKLYDTAHGFYIEIEKPIKCKKVWYDKNNLRHEEEYVEMVPVKEYIAPDFKAQAFYLTNRDPDHWQNRKQTDFTGNINGSMGIEVKFANEKEFNGCDS